MKYLLLTIHFVVMVAIMSSCKKNDNGLTGEPCSNITFEITGDTAEIDSVYFQLHGSGSIKPQVSKSYSNINVPNNTTVAICKYDFDYYLICFDTDSNLVLTLKVFRDGSLIDQKTEKLKYFTTSLGGGIND